MFKKFFSDSFGCLLGVKKVPQYYYFLEGVGYGEKLAMPWNSNWFLILIYDIWMVIVAIPCMWWWYLRYFLVCRFIILLLKKRSGSLEKLAMPWNSSCFADFNMDGYSSLLWWWYLRYFLVCRFIIFCVVVKKKKKRSGSLEVLYFLLAKQCITM